MGYFFAVLIVAFAIIALLYLWVNDFARETLDVVFPAIGAILLSAYLGVKTIWLDAPDAQRSRVPIAILTDRAAGAVHSMVIMRATDPVERFSDFAGIREVDSLQVYNAFSDLHLADRLRAAASANDSTTEHQIWTDMVEYAMLLWLAKPDTSVGWDDLGTIHMLQGSGGAGGIPGTHQSLPVSLTRDEYNELVSKQPISIRVPPGSKVVRRRNNSERMIELRTPHSYFRIVLALRGGSQLQTTVNPVASKLTNALHLSTKTPAWITAFMVNLETGQAPLRRFSDDAKREAVWLARARSQFESDFSWDLLRARLYSD